jgi:hypothetical protein
MLYLVETLEVLLRFSFKAGKEKKRKEKKRRDFVESRTADFVWLASKWSAFASHPENLE